MAYYIHASLYEVKTNLSKFVRALDRGLTDFVIIQRYGRNMAYMRPFKDRTAEKVLWPKQPADFEMWERAEFIEDGGKPSRRP